MDSVTIKHIEDLMNRSQISTMKLGNKTTVVSVVLPNGFIIVESSSCVDPANYDEKLGYAICVSRIQSKLWELEGYLLQENKYQNELFRQEEYDEARKEALINTKNGEDDEG